MLSHGYQGNEIYFSIEKIEREKYIHIALDIHAITSLLLADSDFNTPKNVKP